MFQLRPYDDLAAMAVLQALDVADQMEVQLVRGQVTGHLALFAEWRAMQAGFIASFIAQTPGGVPFAVFGLSPSGHAGVGVAALLARDHWRFRRPLAELSIEIRKRLARYCADTALHRIEARSWAEHPSAKRLLTAIGFCYEVSMPGFGPAGSVVFDQYAYRPACIPPRPHLGAPKEQARVL